MSRTTKFRALLYVALITYALSILGAAVASREFARSDATRLVRPAPIATSQPQLIGFALNVHHAERLSDFLEAVDELARLGFNSLQINTPCFQTNGASVDVRVQVGPGRSPSRVQLVRVLNHARQRGLKTLLMPIVLFTDPRGNEWRGKIEPDRWKRWWDSYRRNVDYFLDIAIQTDVQVFSVGSELLSTERQTGQWLALIAKVRRRFKGQLIYSTNWDHYHVPTFWRHLDLIGINGYWDLTKGADSDRPSSVHLAQRWRQIRRRVLAFAKTCDRSVIFTEIGYPSLPWALKDPWNYVVSDDQIKADPDTQSLGYAAFLSAWDDLLHPPGRVAPTGPFTNGPDLAGVFFYEWDLYHQGGEKDRGYGVRGKSTLDLLKTWLSN